MVAGMVLEINAGLSFVILLSQVVVALALAPRTMRCTASFQG